MNLTVTVTDQAAQTVRADWTFEPSLEATSQPVFIDWGDGTAEEMVAAGTLTKNHDYAKDGFYRIYARSNEVRVHWEVTVGPTAGMGPIWDERAIRDNTYAGQQERALEDARAVTRATSRVGTPRTKLRKVGR